jgi:hypothetical protein
LICDDCEPEFVRVEIQRTILVGDWNADEFDLLDHDALKLIGFPFVRPQAIARLCQKPLSVYRYSRRIHFFLPASYFILFMCLASDKPFPSTITFSTC